MSDGAVDPAAFRQLMARWPTGVAVVTARDGDHDLGLTVNALLSVSLQPPTLLVSLGVEADTTPAIARTRRFAASFLPISERRLSERFARTAPPEEKFRDLPIDRTPSGLAVLPGALARLECAVRSIVPVADHRLVVGEVVWTELGPDASPLVFHRSGYAEREDRDRIRLPSSLSPGPGGRAPSGL